MIDNGIKNKNIQYILYVSWQMWKDGMLIFSTKNTVAIHYCYFNNIITYVTIKYTLSK